MRHRANPVQCLTGVGLQITGQCVEKCIKVARSGDYGLLIGVGGGSTMDTTKAVRAVAPDDMTPQEFFGGQEVSKVLPMILAPTTAGTGSEWDEGAVITDEPIGQKRWIIKDYFLADAVVLDAELTLSLPKRVTADTGMDALAHAVESYISPEANIISDMFAEKAIKLVSDNLIKFRCKMIQDTSLRDVSREDLVQIYKAAL